MTRSAGLTGFSAFRTVDGQSTSIEPSAVKLELTAPTSARTAVLPRDEREADERRRRGRR